MQNETILGIYVSKNGQMGQHYDQQKHLRQNKMSK